jgi:hypothetical protein
MKKWKQHPAYDAERVLRLALGDELFFELLPEHSKNGEEFPQTWIKVLFQKAIAFRS